MKKRHVSMLPCHCSGGTGSSSERSKSSLYTGSTVYITGYSGASEYDGEPCVVVKFEEDTEKWLLRTLHPRFEGQEVRVVDKHVLFGYRVLPEHALGEHILDAVDTVDDQGACGRGLTVSKAVAEGAIVFEESPFVVTADDANEISRTYFMMRSQARSDTGMGKAVMAFNELTTGKLPSNTVKRCISLAEDIVQAASGSVPNKEDPLWNEEVANITEVLLRWEANRFRITVDEKAASYALYSFVTRMNHSCVPTAASCWVPSSDSIGRCVVTAARDLLPGEELCHNYGPPELVTWPLAQRRKYLLENNGFFCKCTRCLGDLAAAKRN